MKTKSKIYIALGIFVVILLGVIMLVKEAEKKAGFRTLDEIVSTGKLRVISDNSSLGFVVKNDKISGFQYEILKIFADSLGVELKISTSNDLHECIAKLRRGKLDIVAKLVPITTEWIDVVSFTNPILVSRQMLVQRLPENAESKFIRNQRELANDTIFVTRNSPYRMRLKHLSCEIAAEIHVVEIENKNAEQLVKLVSEGKIRHTIVHEQLARKITQKYHNLDASLPIGFPQTYAWIVNKKSDELLEKLNDFFANFIGSTEYWNLYRKYY